MADVVHARVAVFDPTHTRRTRHPRPVRLNEE
jgi:hypothetical protein